MFWQDGGVKPSGAAGVDASHHPSEGDGHGGLVPMSDSDVRSLIIIKPPRRSGKQHNAAVMQMAKAAISDALRLYESDLQKVGTPYLGSGMKAVRLRMGIEGTPQTGMRERAQGSGGARLAVRPRRQGFDAQLSRQLVQKRIRQVW
jgi:hypothetical protein